MTYVIKEAGVTSPSMHYFNVPSPRAIKILFYPKCIGHYYCNGNYLVDRLNYDSFLFLYVVNGTGKITVADKTISLSKGTFAYIDCYKPHKYSTTEGWEIFWLHFDGVLARRYFEEILGSDLGIFHCNLQLGTIKNLIEIYDHYNSRFFRLDEITISSYITRILTALFDSQENHSHLLSKSNAMKDTLHFISSNISSELTVSMLADRVFLSKYHFIRVFKKETGYTPHEYILLTRVNATAHALKTTNMKIKDIAFHYGFLSESSFCTTFKKIMGISPRTYRIGIK